MQVNYSYSFTFPKGEEPKFGKCIAAVLLFIFTNLAVTVVAVVKFFGIIQYTPYNILYFALVPGIGIAFCAMAVFFTVKYIFITVTKSGYKYLTPFFKTVSVMIAERYANDDKFQQKLNVALDFGEAFGKTYDNKTPWLVKKAAGFFIGRLPFVEFFKKMSPGINKRDIRAVSESIYGQMDEYMVKKLFVNNNMKWVFILYPLNLAAQIVLLCLLR